MVMVLCVIFGFVGCVCVCVLVVVCSRSGWFLEAISIFTAPYFLSSIILKCTISSVPFYLFRVNLSMKMYASHPVY
jgi:hypothetical protein